MRIYIDGQNLIMDCRDGVFHPFPGTDVRAFVKFVKLYCTSKKTVRVFWNGRERTVSPKLSEEDMADSILGV